MVSRINSAKLHRFLGISIICMLFLTLFLYAYKHYHSISLLQQAKTHLVSIAEKRVQAIENYVDQKKISLHYLTTNAVIINAFKNPSSLTAQSFSLLTQSFADTNSLQNIILIQPDGSIIYSKKEPALFKVNLTNIPYDETNLGQSFQQALFSLTPTFSIFSYDFFLKTPSLYLVLPVYDNNILVGCIAAQLAHKDFYTIAQEYFGLGKTGEVYFTSLLGNTVQIISPTRHNPNTAFENSEYMLAQPNTFKEKSVLGTKGNGVGPDYRAILGVGAWDYIADLGWGVVVKMDVQEVLSYMYILDYIIAALVMLLIALIIIYFFFFKYYLKSYTTSLESYSKSNHISFTKLGSAFLVLCMLSLCLFGYLYYYTLDQRAINETKNIAEVKLQDMYLTITNDVQRAMLRTNSIADDLSIGRLKKEDILVRMKRELQENPSILGISIAFAPYTYDNNRKLFAPHVTQHNKNIAVEYLEKLYDYTESGPQVLGENDWYLKTMASKSKWFDPTKEPLYNKTVAWYGVPFFAINDTNNTAPIGIVMIEYDLDFIATAAQKLIIGDTGYTFVASQNGTFLYHPNKNFIEDKKTIVDLARIYNSQELKDIATKMQELPTGIFYFINPADQEPVWIIFKTVPQLQWKLGVIFPEQEIAVMPETVRHLKIWIEIGMVLLLTLLAFLLTNPTFENVYSLKRFSILSSIIFIGALIILFSIIWDTQIVLPDKNDIVVNNETSLRSFLVDKEQKIKNRYEKLTLIPTGIVLYSLAFPDTEHVTFTGSIWQKYDANDTTTPRNLRFPEATDVTIKKEFEELKDGIQVIGWKVTATLRQYYNHSKYPFDVRTVTIPLTPPISKDKNVLCIPAFGDYKTQKENQHLGISQELSLSEFNIHDTYFDFNTEPQLSTLGLEGQSNSPNEITLQYNLLLTRSLINALIVYIVPILVILFSLYAIFIKTIGIFLSQLNVVTSLIAPYTGLLFALIVLHGALRSNYKGGGFLYIEGFFSLAYITLLVFILHALFTRRDPDKAISHTSLFLKLFFWPLQFACWFIITAIVFYN